MSKYFEYAFCENMLFKLKKYSNLFVIQKLRSSNKMIIDVQRRIFGETKIVEMTGKLFCRAFVAVDVEWAQG